MTFMIDTVLFDYGGVIAEEGFRGGLFAIARANNLRPDAFHKDVCRIIADTGYLTGRESEAAFWAHLRRSYGLVQADGELRDEILRRFVLRPVMIDRRPFACRGGAGRHNKRSDKLAR
jgi:putative hydrolase of the HAD superfamily